MKSIILVALQVVAILSIANTVAVANPTPGKAGCNPRQGCDWH